MIKDRAEKLSPLAWIDTYHCSIAFLVASSPLLSSFTLFLFSSISPVVSLHWAFCKHYTTCLDRSVQRNGQELRFYKVEPFEVVS